MGQSSVSVPPPTNPLLLVMVPGLARYYLPVIIISFARAMENPTLFPSPCRPPPAIRIICFPYTFIPARWVSQVVLWIYICLEHVVPPRKLAAGVRKGCNKPTKHHRKKNDRPIVALAYSHSCLLPQQCVYAIQITHLNPILCRTTLMELLYRLPTTIPKVNSASEGWQPLSEAKWMVLNCTLQPSTSLTAFTQWLPPQMQKRAIRQHLTYFGVELTKVPPDTN